MLLPGVHQSIYIYMYIQNHIWLHIHMRICINVFVGREVVFDARFRVVAMYGY